ncbi:unnamed protein product [Rotaria sp. Silwood1]|nr:unnamed protein product [Rotaria sp. Silwood1]CAF1210842.1 unnamed protein product [Rotaria sp. Silwood1]CAF1233921.1 unnamed protein product [Rotaria sp. Silwood1]CAF3451480.1 unnamed protein product [Rotaria sp. Silwood1]CAF3464240.1 unnamed protein product [Rotaria sp. Silwood1]
MSHNFSRLEHLPNEILVEIFEYISTQDLFRTFYNLNYRLNTLIQSLHNHYLSLTTTDCNQIYRYNFIAPYVNILCIEGRAQLNLESFTNIRRLILIQSTDELLEQIERIHMPYLENLVIRSANRRETDFIPFYWNRIFSYDLSYLKICCMHNISLTWTYSSWRKMLSLCILKIGDIDILVYGSILLACPNLYFFKFTRLISNNKSTNIIQHMNLKKLVIVIPWFEDLSQDYSMNDYFSYVPNLEQLIIHRTNDIKSINESYLQYDWYRSSITSYLPLLSHYYYYFHILKSNRLNNLAHQNIFNRIQQRFNNIHRHLYQRRFIFDFIG